jgi:hypothetical protein
MPVRLPMQYSVSSFRINVCIARKWQRRSQKTRPRAVSLTVSWMWATPFSSTLMRPF